MIVFGEALQGFVVHYVQGIYIGTNMKYYMALSCSVNTLTLYRHMQLQFTVLCARYSSVFDVIDLGGTTVLNFEADDYLIDFEKELPLTVPIVSGQQNYFTKVVLDPITEGVIAGGMIHILDKSQQVFRAANITITDSGKLLGSSAALHRVLCEVKY